MHTLAAHRPRAGASPRRGHGGRRHRSDALFLLALAGTAAAGTADAAAQQRPTESRVAVMPLVGISWMGVRFDGEAPPDTTLPERRWQLGPSNGPLFGAALEVRATPTLAFGASAAFSRHSYRLKSGTTYEPELEIGIAGSQDVFRFTAGARYRVRASAPGYFSAGAASNLVRPRNPTWTPTEQDRLEIGGYAGAGIDFRSRNRRLRVEARAIATSNSADPVPGALGAALYRPRSIVYDFTLLVGLLFDL